jgi:hypothetical protein
MYSPAAHHLVLLLLLLAASADAAAPPRCSSMRVQELWTRAAYHALGIPQSAWDDPQSSPAIASGLDYSGMPTSLSMFGPNREEL